MQCDTPTCQVVLYDVSICQVVFQFPFVQLQQEMMFSLYPVVAFLFPFVSTCSDALYDVSTCPVVCLFPLVQMLCMMFSLVQLCVCFHLFRCFV